LHANLLIPHLSERARSLLLRLDQTRQNDYDEVKKFLLSEFQLTAFQFKTRFDNAKRKGDEAWTLFCARLKNLLEYYCRSRDVADEFSGGSRGRSVRVRRMGAYIPPPASNTAASKEVFM
jgi:hypothetical protein